MNLNFKGWVAVLRLDYECVRNILLTVESLGSKQTLSADNYMTFPLISNYSVEEFHYTVSRLNEAGFFPKGSVLEVIDGIIIRLDALTWEGHQYLDCIRDENIWSQARKKVSGFGSVPLKVLGEIAASLIRSHVGLPN